MRMVFFFGEYGFEICQPRMSQKIIPISLLDGVLFSKSHTVVDKIIIVAGYLIPVVSVYHTTLSWFMLIPF